jgi:uncharacterized SAM-binding protein YcdF (DUF218 family)
MRRRAVILVTLAAVAGSLGASFQGFWEAATAPIPAPPATVDAIVVLTGGAARVKAGLERLADDRGRQLFISGAHEGVVVADLLHQGPPLPPATQARIFLGRASDTAGNAAETAAWCKANGVKSLRLITAYYHMPRSLALFASAMPDVAIWPDPVEPAGVAGRTWWQNGRGLSLILGEWLKYMATRAGLAG